MNVVLTAALQEFELLQMEKQDCEEIVADKTLPEISRAAADIRLAGLDVCLNLTEGVIMHHLEKIPVEEYLMDINNNLSDQWN